MFKKPQHKSESYHSMQKKVESWDGVIGWKIKKITYVHYSIENSYPDNKDSNPWI